MMSDEMRVMPDEKFPKNIMPLVLVAVVASTGLLGTHEIRQHVIANNLDIKYENINFEEDYEFDSTIDYEALNIKPIGEIGKIEISAVKVLTFKTGDIVQTRLVTVVNQLESLEIKDIETGATIVKKEFGEYLVGEDVEIIKQKDISSYLKTFGINEKKYDVNQLIYIFNEAILPICEEQKQLKK